MTDLIPIGWNCYTSGNLRMLELRTESLPFDWILLPQLTGPDIITHCIKTDFEDFFADLEYDGIRYTMSKIGVGFSHHDPNALKTIQAFLRRMERFNEIIASSSPKTYIYGWIDAEHYHNPDSLNTFVESMKSFEECIKHQPDSKILVYVRDLVDFDFIEQEHILEKTIFKKHIKYSEVDTVYGCQKEFLEFLQH